MSDVYLWETYQKIGREALDRNDLQQADESFQAAVSVAEELGNEDPRLAVSLRSYAAVKVALGEPSTAHQVLEKTLEITLTHLGDDHPESQQVRRQLAQVSRELGFLDKAEEHYRLHLQQAKAAEALEEVQETLESLAHLAQERQRPEQAASLYQEITETRMRLHGAEHPSVAQALLWLASAQAKLQQEQAESTLNRAFEILEKQFKDEPTALAQSLVAGAELLVQSGLFESALEHQKRAVDLFVQALGEDHERIWETRQLIASTLAGMGQIPEAAELLEYCWQQQPQRTDHHAGALLKNLAGLYLALKDLEKAEEFYRRAAGILEKNLGPEHPAFLATQEERIQLYHFNGQSDKALEIALTLITTTEKRFGPGHPNTAQTYASTALLAHGAQQWETALELMRAAEKIWTTLRPQPLDVLANCRTNQITCLMELQKFEEAKALMDMVRPTAPAALLSVLDRLQQNYEAWFQSQAPPETVPSGGEEVSQIEQSTISVGEVHPEPYNLSTDGDRRSHPRRNLEFNRFFDLQISDSASGPGQETRCFLVDVSLGGLRINSEKPLPPETSFWIELPQELGGQVPAFEARVVWQRDLFGTSTIQGVELLNITTEQREALQAAIGEAPTAERTEGRQHFRLYRPVPIQVFRAEEEVWEPLYASDLSQQGLGVQTQQDLDPEDQVRIRLMLEFELPIVEVSAKVAWSRKSEKGYAHGLKFYELGPVEAKAIGLYIDHCMEQAL